MSQNLSFDIKIPEGHMVQFNQEATFENFIGQFQQLCSKLLCVIDGTQLRYYDNANALPTNIRFDYKQRRGKITEYYFRDIGNDTLYCVFGRESAKIIFPRIDEVDPSGANELISQLKSPADSQINNNEVKNIKSKEEVPIQSRKSPSDSPSSICRPKRPPIIQPIRSTQATITPIRESLKTNIVTRIIPNKSNVPENIVIIDKGVRLTFPNPNYPIEITTYYP